MARGNSQKKADGSALDFEAQLWAAADKMRGHMAASEYKHVCLGLIFLKYISDAFEEKREQLLFGYSDPKSEWFIKDEPGRADAAENRDEYLAANVFWLPPEARWHTIKAKAKSPEIGKVIDDAMGAIERENPARLCPAQPRQSPARRSRGHHQQHRLQRIGGQVQGRARARL